MIALKLCWNWSLTLPSKSKSLLIPLLNLFSLGFVPSFSIFLTKLKVCFARKWVWIRKVSIFSFTYNGSMHPECSRECRLFFRGRLINCHINDFNLNLDLDPDSDLNLDPDVDLKSIFECNPDSKPRHCHRFFQQHLFSNQAENDYDYNNKCYCILYFGGFSTCLPSSLSSFSTSSS